MIEVTMEDVVRVAEEVVSTQLDYVYTNPNGLAAIQQASTDCFYVHGDAPGCVVGHILHRLGVPLEDLSYYEGLRANSVLLDLGDEEVIKMPNRAVSLLQCMQGEQDTGKTWGEAYFSALKRDNLWL